MPKNRKGKQDSAHMESELKRVKRELALLAPPKVENRLVTVQDFIRLTRNSTVVTDPTTTYAFSGNGIYKFNNTSSTPAYLTVP
jgi:hypothetical protein